MASDRVWLTLATLGIAVGFYLLMLKGWRGRQRRQGDLPAPRPMPAERGGVVVGATPGLFVGTVFAGDWLDRVAVHALSDRAAGWLTVHAEGVRLDREGTGDLWLPYDTVLDATLGDALAGKVVGRDGMLVLSWELGGRQLESGFRADDHDAHRRLADAIRAHLPVRPDVDSTRSSTEETL